MKRVTRQLHRSGDAFPVILVSVSAGLAGECLSAMRRTILNIAAVASLLCGVAICALWVRSYGNNWHGDRFAFRLDQRPWELRSQGGGIALAAIDEWGFSGVSTGGKVVKRYNRRDVFNVAWWIPLAVTTVLPVTWLIRWRRLRRRIIDGLCQRCGYDLRASRGRCPECGNAIGVAAQGAA